MPSSAVGWSALHGIIVLEVLDSNPRTYIFFFLTFFSSQCIFEDIADQIEKNFQGKIAFTFSNM